MYSTGFIQRVGNTIPMKLMVYFIIFREQPIYPQPRQFAESRASPLQSRSFKYLQWITGTED